MKQKEERSMKKSERLNGVILLLKERKRMTAKNLADYFEVSERTIYRDIDALSQLKVPIIAYEGLGGGYEINHNYFIPSIHLSPQESTILLMVLKMGSEIKIPNLSRSYDMIKSKIINVLEKSYCDEVDTMLDKIHFYISKIEPISYEEDIMISLLESIKINHRVKIIYSAPRNQQVTERVISIQQLFFEDGAWYISGYCHLRKEKRTFRIDRINSVEVLDEEALMVEALKSSTDKFQRTNFEILIKEDFYRVIKENEYMKYHEIIFCDEYITLNVTTKFVDKIFELALMHPDQFMILGPPEKIDQLKSKIIKLNKIY